VPEQFQKQYLKVLLQHPEANSQDKFYPSRTDALMHEIALKMEEPIYVKQFKIPDAHHKEVEKHILEWLKLRVIQPARSGYNKPHLCCHEEGWQCQVGARFQGPQQ